MLMRDVTLDLILKHQMQQQGIFKVQSKTDALLFFCSSFPGESPVIVSKLPAAEGCWEVLAAALHYLLMQCMKSLIVHRDLPKAQLSLQRTVLPTSYIKLARMHSTSSSSTSSSCQQKTEAPAHHALPSKQLQFYPQWVLDRVMSYFDPSFSCMSFA